MPYKETLKHGAQFQCPPLELIGNEEEYKVEQIINHRHHGKHCQLQYLICWKGYSAADDTWEPTDQVHANKLVKSYHTKHAGGKPSYKNQRQTKIKTTIQSLLTCLPPTQQTSPLPLPQASPSTWMSLSHSPSNPQPKLLWSTDRSHSQSLQQSWWSPRNSVSCSSPPDQYVLLSKGTDCQVERNSSSSCKGWQELCERTKKSAATIKNSLKYSSNEGKIWQSTKCTQLVWKRPMSTGKPTTTRGLRSGMQKSGDQKDMSLTSLSLSSMVTTSCMSSPPTSNKMAYTAWAPPASVSPSTGMNCSHHSASPSMKRENSLIGSSTPSPTTLCTLQCTTTPTPRRTGES